MGVLGICSLSFVRRYAYELFLNTHIALTGTIIVAVFLHLNPFDISQPSTILLIIAGSADITLAKPRQVGAGQYVFLRIPSTSAYAFNESHPFFIASWDHNKENKTRNITALIQRHKRFTRLLKAQPTPVRAFLEGPYGESPSAENYGNVILFASGIGIAAHLGCIKQLLNARDQGSTRTQVISLLWEVDEIESWNAAIK
ncbi:hypothetical protein B0O99DRAFT_472861, partial [Bisporella sp. PMI_857]